jgi:hypothetical protein
MTGQRGVALILAVLVTSFLSAVGLGLALIVMMDRLATGNLRGSVAMLYAADAAIELAAREVMTVEDWNLALRGEVRSRFVDGLPEGVRSLPDGGLLDLTAATNGLNCGKATACTPSDMAQSTRDRPWGSNNARWQLFSYGSFGNLAPIGRPASCYVAVWLADDGREVDDDPLVDSEDPGTPGGDVLRIRADAFGPRGARRTVEAELARRCRGEVSGECPMGIRVQSWQEVRQPVP